MIKVHRFVLLYGMVCLVLLVFHCTIVHQVLQLLCHQPYCLTGLLCLYGWIAIALLCSDLMKKVLLDWFYAMARLPVLMSMVVLK